MIPEKIILHHSLTEDSGTVSWNAIRKYHVLELGWRDIGYHFGVEFLRDRHEILVGRMPNEQGAHCKEHNEKSLGICFIGNYDLEQLPGDALVLGVRLVQYLRDLYHIPVREVIGHREAIGGWKSCPGSKFDLDYFRWLLAEGTNLFMGGV